MAFETDPTPETVAVILKSSPVENTAAIPTIAERAAGLAEFGAEWSRGFGVHAFSQSGPIERAVETLNKGKSK